MRKITLETGRNSANSRMANEQSSPYESALADAAVSLFQTTNPDALGPVPDGHKIVLTMEMVEGDADPVIPEPEVKTDEIE